jgi:hypothetical protein
MHLGRECFRDLVKERVLLLAFVVLAPLAGAAVLPASTSLEVRLSEPSGSRISHVGDAVNATVIAPVYGDGRLLIPQGTVVSGSIEQVERLGYGLKHVNSDMQYRFSSLELPDGARVPIDAEVTQVETAKERVSSDGVIGGIYPTANLSSSLASYVIPLLWIDPHFGLPFLGVKVVIARSPDPEIYFPAGTELILRLKTDATVPSAGVFETSVRPLSKGDMGEVRGLLARLPQQRTDRGRNHPSDLINVLFLGNRDALDRAFYAAGWVGAQRSSLMSIFGMYHCMVQRMGYSTAPMGQLTLNGLRADAAYQKSLDTFSKRHHVRLWKQRGEDAWLSSATEDVNYGFRHMHLTHVTDPMIDNERTKVLNDVAFTGCLDSAALVPRARVDQQEKSIQTDGAIAVLRVNDCRHPRSNEDTMPGPRPRRRSVQALVALRNDLIRTNPVFLTYNSVKLLCLRWESRGAGRSSGLAARVKAQRTGASQASVQSNWIRPSVLGAETHVK